MYVANKRPPIARARTNGRVLGPRAGLRGLPIANVKRPNLVYPPFPLCCAPKLSSAWKTSANPRMRLATSARSCVSSCCFDAPQPFRNPMAGSTGQRYGWENAQAENL